uniref:Secretory carrier-associated membrane protein n=1 Tax=Scophthalmus maximus TaxID=52904 RepID=A0A8D2ZUH3_SCOMX
MSSYSISTSTSLSLISFCLAFFRLFFSSHLILMFIPSLLFGLNVLVLFSSLLTSSFFLHLFFSSSCLLPLSVIFHSIVRLHFLVCLGLVFSSLIRLLTIPAICLLIIVFQDALAAHTTPASTSPYQPAVLQPSIEPSPQATAAAAQANLLRQQEELERKAAELDRREQELQSRGPTGKENNWPPLPRKFPIKPCFYQDFSEEIPPEYQRVCKMMYYLWMFNCVTLFLNLLACLAYFTTDAAYGVDFGLSILWVILFSPCSFLCWYRPVYKAFKTDSSFSFFFFFFVFFCQVVIFIIQAVGIPKWGNSGWITAFTALGGSNKAVGAIMITVAILFTACAVLSAVLLKMVHSMYRRTGASCFLLNIGASLWR